MQFALNYSPQAAQLMQAGKLDIALFKCPDWPFLVAEARQLAPVYIHFPLVIGQGQAHVLADIEAWLKQTATRFVNAHIAPREEDFAAGTSEEAIRDVMIAEIGRLCEAFGPERVIIENIPYPDEPYTHGLLPMSREPALFHALIEATGCGLLLDVAHAQRCAAHTGQDPAPYLEAFPVGHLRELHITGLGSPQGFLEDHMPLRDEDWAVVEWVMGRIGSGAWRRPEQVALEYGGIGPMFEWRSDPAVMLEQVPRLQTLIAENQAERQA